MLTLGFEVASYCLEVAFLCMRASTSKIQSPLSDCHKQTRFRSERVGPMRVHSGRQAVLAHKMPQRISAFLRFDAYGASAAASFCPRSSARLRGGMRRAFRTYGEAVLASTDLSVRAISPLLLTCRVMRPRMPVPKM